MKKVLLSLGVIGVFLVYAFHEKQESDSVHVTPPQGLESNNTQLTPSVSPFAGQTATLGPTVNPSTVSSGRIDSQQASPGPSAIPTNTPTRGQYKDGEYTGSVADAFYGNIQVKAIIQGGKITDVQFLQYPNDRSTSIMINQQAMPYLKQEAIQAQSANVDIVSGATDSSQAFQQSLQSALNQAKS